MSLAKNPRGVTAELLRNLTHMTLSEAAAEVGISPGAAHGHAKRYGFKFKRARPQRALMRALSREVVTVDLSNRPDLARWLVEQCPADVSLGEMMAAICEDARFEEVGQ